MLCCAVLRLVCPSLPGGRAGCAGAPLRWHQTPLSCPQHNVSVPAAIAARCAADEIDAIGKARSNGPTDSGTQEREQGLLQLLTEMDGFFQNDRVGGLLPACVCTCVPSRSMPPRVARSLLTPHMPLALSSFPPLRRRCSLRAFPYPAAPAGAGGGGHQPR